MAPAAVGFASLSVMGPIIAFLLQHPNKRKRKKREASKREISQASSIGGLNFDNLGED